MADHSKGIVGKQNRKKVPRVNMLPKTAKGSGEQNIMDNRNKIKV